MSFCRTAVRFSRSILSGLFFVNFGFFGLTATFLILPFCFSKTVIRVLVRYYFKFFVLLAKITGLFTVKLHGNLDSIKGEIVVMNHLSLIDIVILLALLPDSICIIKGDLRHNFFMKAIVTKIFLLNDEDPLNTIENAKMYLAKRVNLVIFPEGTRSKVGDKNRKVHRGAARLAIASKTKIRPLFMTLDPLILAKNQPWWDVGDKIIRFDIFVKSAIQPNGENTRENAIKWTELIDRAIRSA